MGKQSAEVELPPCVRDERCLMTLDEGYVRCGEGSVLPSLPLAESLCAQALRLINDRLKPKKQPALDGASLSLECSLAGAPGDSSAAELAQAKARLQAVLDSPNSSGVPLFNAMLLEAALPLFASRREKRESTETELIETHINFARVLSWAQTTDRMPTGESHRKTAIAVAAIGCIANRNRRPSQVFYPGSSREARNGFGLADHNHNYYRVINGRKAAVSVRSVTGADAHPRNRNTVAVVNYASLIWAVVGYEHLKYADWEIAAKATAERLPQLLVREAEGEGERLSRADVQLLDMSSAELRMHTSKTVPDNYLKHPNENFVKQAGSTGDRIE